MKKIFDTAKGALAPLTEVLRQVPSWAALCVLAAVMIVTGAIRGDAAAQLAKAIRVCLECIGIG